MSREVFWLNDPANLFKRWDRFVPTNNMTVPEALNAVLRFVIYAGVTISVVTHKSIYLLLIPTVMFVTIVLYNLFPTTQILKETFSTKVSGKYATPTSNNPFMNVLFTDYVDDPDRPAAPPDVTSPNMVGSIDEAFSKTNDLFMDTSDKFALAQSARNWVTQASTTIPNDLDGFQKFLNKDNVSQKLPSESYTLAKGSVSSIPPGQFQ
ncbi:hypothetical protein EB118_05290 [bacterium]|nr:hypothetical protein [Actinomycetota bacterium]NDG29498.1 hypothetical protein [bacterium]